jgi:predicted transposase/invertase (TIGR01784 family)
VELTELSPQELSNEPIRADSLILLQSEDLVLHTEFQTQAKTDIPFRMLDYRLRVHRRFPNKRMRQIVVYLRPTNSPLVYQNSFNLEKTQHQFEIIRLWEQSTEQFFKLTGLFPLASLSQTNAPTIVLSQVTELISGLSDEGVKRNLTAASAILAGLILEKEIINRIIRSEIMKESVIYQEIYQEGKQLGVNEGLEQGSQSKAKEIALNLLRLGMSVAQIAQVTNLSIEKIQALAENLN